MLLLLISLLTSLHATTGEEIKPAWVIRKPAYARNPSTWDCFRNYSNITDGYSAKAIIHLSGNGIVDDAAGEAVIAAGSRMLSVDGLVTPCFTCYRETQGDIACPISTASISHLQRLWFSVDTPSSWSDNVTENVEFLETLIAAAQQKCQIPLHFTGIFTNEEDWRKITGDSTNFSKDYVLGLREYDYNPEIRGVKMFGGWTNDTVVAKVYASMARVCGLVVDKVYYECTERFPCENI